VTLRPKKGEVRLVARPKGEDRNVSGSTNRRDKNAVTRLVRRGTLVTSSGNILLVLVVGTYLPYDLRSLTDRSRSRDQTYLIDREVVIHYIGFN